MGEAIYRGMGLDKLNSLTKYPSIPTYHALGEKGALLDEHVAFPDHHRVIATEKVDGTNARIVVVPDGPTLIGSRGEWLHAVGDLVANQSQGIVSALLTTAKMVPRLLAHSSSLRAFYFEVYGGKVGAASKQYTGHRAVGVRMFDAMEIAQADYLPGGPIEEIAQWRDNGSQPFLPEDSLSGLARALDVGLAPRVECAPPPSGIAETQRWLEEAIPRSLVTIDDEAGARPEGLVIRTPRRNVIAKVRFEDYKRHAKRSRQ